MGRTKKNIKLRIPEKPRKIKGIPVRELPSSDHDFECSSLQPLRYASMYKYSLLGTNHTISSQPRYDHFDTSPCPRLPRGLD